MIVEVENCGASKPLRPSVRERVGAENPSGSCCSTELDIDGNCNPAVVTRKRFSEEVLEVASNSKTGRLIAR